MSKNVIYKTITIEYKHFEIPKLNNALISIIVILSVVVKHSKWASWLDLPPYSSTIIGQSKREFQSKLGFFLFRAQTNMT